MKPIKTPKPKKCIVCGNEYVRTRLAQIACSPKCAIEYSKSPDKKVKDRVSSELRKVERAARKAAKEKIKSRSEYLKDAQTAFNKFIRLRDEKEPCISCQRYHEGQYHAGHYRTVGACPELRFEEFNCNKQCSACNNHKSGNIVEYRINLVRKIGADKVEWLESKHEPKKYTIDEIKQIKKHYEQKIKQLKG